MNTFSFGLYLNLGAKSSLQSVKTIYLFVWSSPKFGGEAGSLVPADLFFSSSPKFWVEIGFSVHENNFFVLHLNLRAKSALQFVKIVCFFIFEDHCGAIARQNFACLTKNSVLAACLPLTTLLSQKHLLELRTAQAIVSYYWKTIHTILKQWKGALGWLMRHRSCGQKQLFTFVNFFITVLN